MTTTTTFKGMDPSGRSSSRVLRPPGGGSNFNLGFDLPKEQQGGRRSKMASSIFGTPEENPPSWARSTAKSSDISENPEELGSDRINSSDANSGDCVDPKSGEGEAPGAKSHAREVEYHPVGLKIREYVDQNSVFARQLWIRSRLLPCEMCCGTSVGSEQLSRGDL
ncbi:jupiter microtubule associated homolog 1 isoform X2 [Pogona vitticeps]